MSESEFNRKVYNVIAAEYKSKREQTADSTWNDCLEAPAIAAILRPIVNAKQVLDLGCGTGILTKQIIKWGGNVCGVDQSEKMLELAKSDIPQVDFHLSSADKLAFPDQTFDVVASSLVMHYIQDLRPVFMEVARVLKENGRFVFSMHHPIQESFKREEELTDGKPVLQSYFHNEPYYWTMCGEELLSFHHTFEDIVRGLSSNGFVVSDLRECRPAINCKDSFSDYEFTLKYPTFCVFEAVKINHKKNWF